MLSDIDCGKINTNITNINLLVLASPLGGRLYMQDDQSIQNDSTGAMQGIQQLANQPAVAVEPPQSSPPKPPAPAVPPLPNNMPDPAQAQAQFAPQQTTQPTPDFTAPSPFGGAQQQTPANDFTPQQQNNVDEPLGPPPITPPPASSKDDSVDHDKLADMKQHALDHLEPLVEKLDQPAEETFKTTMMMIQANDNHKLLEKALAAAKLIKDDGERAQALLDIINEINYFAQNNEAN